MTADEQAREAADLPGIAQDPDGLPGLLPKRDLPGSVAAESNAEVDAAVARAVREACFREVLAARGVTAVALDDEGRLTCYYPDGSTGLLPPDPGRGSTGQLR